MFFLQGRGLMFFFIAVKGFDVFFAVKGFDVFFYCNEGFNVFLYCSEGV